MKLHEQLCIDIGAIDRMLRHVLESDEALSGSPDILDHALALIDAGGKRLRPMLALVGGRFGNASRQAYVMKAAAVLEYIHTASLIHDDIIDKSDLRRGKPTLHTKVGIAKAVFIANYMMARAVEWASDDWDVDKDSASSSSSSPSERDMGRIAELASLITELCLGEYGQLRDRFNFDLTLEQYLDKTRSKTALLMAHCLRAGAEAAEADSRTSELLYQFGEALGIAFQIRDDILDFAESVATIGKPAGADLRNGNVTLPVLLALKNHSLAERIRSLGAASSDEQFAEAISLIADSGAVEQAREFARSYTDRAAAIAEELSPHPAGADLLPLLRYFSE